MRKFTADFETNVSETDCRVWAYALCEIGNTNNKRRSGKSGEAHFRNNVRNGNQGMNNQHVNQQGKNFNRSYNKNNENYGDANRRNDVNSHGRRPNL